MTDEIAVRVTVSGRIGLTLCTAFTPLRVESVPSHDVIVVGSGQVLELVALLQALEQWGVVVDRIASPATVSLDHERPGHVRP